jgi:hypothetical protein
VYDASANIYWGTNDGKIWKHVLATGVITVLYDVTNAAVESLVLYSSALWAGLSDGRVVEVTVS